MKKSLLFLASLFMTVAMFADWTQPIPKASASYQYSTLAEEGAGDSIIYYLYNKDAKAFLTQGNAWGTQASIASTGLKYMVSKYVEDGAEWDGKTVLISDYPTTKGAWYLLFIDGETAAYVDHGSQANYFWEIEDMGNSTFRIRGAAKNPTYNPTSYPGCYFGMSYSADETTTAISPEIDPVEDPTAQIDWQFISEADYAEYLTANEIYQMAVKLGDAITRANTDYPGKINTSAAEAVYNNTSSTLAELTAAYNAMNDAIKKAEFGDATEDNPKDVTEWLTNPTFEGNANGWTNTFVSSTNATNVGYQSASYTNGEVTISQFIEAWANDVYSKAITTRAIGVGELSQTVGGMPQGKYKFTVDCIANNQDGITPVNGVQLFAKGGTLDVFKTLATGNGAPEHFELVFVSDGDSLTIGLRTTEDCNANWIAADNFTLTYYGPTSEDPTKINMDEIVKEALEDYPIEGEAWDELLANVEDKAAYKAAIEEAQAATEDYTAKGEAVTAAKNALESSANAYAAYQTEVDYIATYLSEHSLTSEDAELLADYVMEDNEVEPDDDFPFGSAAYIYNNLLPTTEEITAETERITEQLKTAIATSLNEGDDCTDMISDADFSDANGTGWTNTYSSGVTWTGGLIATTAYPNAGFPVAESYHAYFDVHQVVEGAPDGVYALSLNGFCRLDNGQSEVPAEIYMNEFATPLMNITEDQIPFADAVDGFNAYLSNGDTSAALTTNPIFMGGKRQSPNDACDSEGDTGYYPNGMEGASVAFSADRFKATVYGLVTGGSMTVGVRNTTDLSVWCLWGNFKLTYMGKNEEAISSLLTTYEEKLNNYVEDNSGSMTEPAVNDALAAVAAAEDAGDADEAYDALIGLNDQLVAAKANVEAVNTMNEANEAAVAFVESYPDVDATPYNDIADKIADYSSLTTEEVNALTDEINNAVKAMKYNAIAAQVATATADEPVDITEIAITNNGFEDGLTGWNDCGGINWQSQTNTSFAKTDNTYCERWHVSGTLDINQTVTLPAGTYVLYVDAYTSTADAAIYAGENETSVPATSDATVKTTYSVEFTLTETTDVVLGAKATLTSSTWNCIDNFVLVSKGNDPTAIKNVETATSKLADATAIYSVAGARVNTLQKGINIVKMADGTVKKVMVK